MSFLYVRLRDYLRDPRTRAELQKFCKISSRDYFRTKILGPLVDAKKVKLTIPDKPTRTKQKYVWNGYCLIHIQSQSMKPR